MNETKSVITTITSQISRSKTVKRKVSVMLLTRNIDETGYMIFRNIGFELYLLPDPVGTFFGDSLLGQFIAQLDFKI